MRDGLWISDCVITSDGQWVVFSQDKPLTKPDRAKMKEGKLEILIETRIYSFDLRTRVIVQSRRAHKCSVSCFSLLNDNELLTGGSTDGCIRIWQLPDLNPVGELDLSSPEKAKKLEGAWPFQLHHNTKLPQVTANDAIDTLLAHICTESGVPTHARAARLQQLPENETRLKIIARHPSRLAAIRLITTDEGKTHLITVSKTGSVLIQTPDGVQVS